MQRAIREERTGYLARKVALRKRRMAGSQPSRPAVTPLPLTYRVRVRNASPQPRNTWGGYVSALREAVGISRAELARRLGVDPTTVWRWETAGSRPESAEVPEALAALFKLDLDEVLAAAGLKTASVPAAPTREVDEEVENIMSSNFSDRVKRELLEVLAEERARDKARRIDNMNRLMDARRRRTG